MTTTIRVKKIVLQLNDYELGENTTIAVFGGKYDNLGKAVEYSTRGKSGVTQRFVALCLASGIDSGFTTIERAMRRANAEIKQKQALSLVA